MAVLSSNAHSHRLNFGRIEIMYITKGQGAIISILPVALYTTLYYFFVEKNVYVTEFTAVFTLGALLLFYQNIEPGTRVPVLWFGNWIYDENKNRCEWGGGPCLVPSFPPFLRALDVPCLWGLQLPITEEVRFNHESNAFFHLQDQRLPQYRVNTEASLLAASFSRFAEFLLRKLNPWNGDPRFFHWRLGTLLVWVMIALGWATNHAQSVSRSLPEFSLVGIFNFFGGSVSAGPAGYQQPPHKEIEVRVQLEKASISTFPAAHYFSPNPKEVFEYEEIAGRHYARWTESHGKLSVTRVFGSLCFAVPASKKLGVHSSTPPVFAANMVDEVEYYRKQEYVSLPHKVSARIFERRPLDSPNYWKRSSWQILYDRWTGVDTSEYLLMQALPQDQIPGGAPGGLVCF